MKEKKMEKHKRPEPELLQKREPIFEETFYAGFSLILIGFMFLLLVTETVLKYKGTKRHFTIEMSKYFDRVGLVMIAYVVFCIAMFLYEYGLSGIKVYFQKNKHELFFVIFLLYSLVAAILSSDKEVAFFGATYRDAGFISYLKYAAAYICGRQICYFGKQDTTAINTGNSKKDRLLEKAREQKATKGHLYKVGLYFMFMAVCTFQNTLLIADYFGYKKGTELGAFYNINHSAYFMVISIFAMIGYASVAKHIVLKILGYEMYAINLWCLIINNSLGGYVAVIVGLILLVVLYVLKYKKVGFNVIVTIMLFVVVSVATDYETKIISNNFHALFGDTKSIAQDTSSEASGDAGSGRWSLWLKGMAYVKEHPIIGCGPDCMPFDEETGDLLTLPHNEYLQYAMEIGTPASLCYIIGLLLLFILRLKTLKQTDDSAIYDCCAVMGYCASAFFGINIFYSAVYFYIILGATSAKYYT